MQARDTSFEIKLHKDALVSLTGRLIIIGLGLFEAVPRGTVKFQAMHK